MMRSRRNKIPPPGLITARAFQDHLRQPQGNGIIRKTSGGDMPAPRINMVNRVVLCSAICLVGFATLLAHLTGCGGGGVTAPPPPPPPLAGQKIQHIVIIFQENRTPDNLFHGLPNADIADSGVNSLGQVIPLTPIALANDYDLSHAHTAFV
ncbi:MAG TPA: hypothetical protein VE778_02460, partial [Candidatus Bathyarchaeia archaeon]|nr:hypothetical protein [Candidatus Bathyarchaeia archaeon]